MEANITVALLVRRVNKMIVGEIVRFLAGARTENGFHRIKRVCACLLLGYYCSHLCLSVTRKSKKPIAPTRACRKKDESDTDDNPPISQRSHTFSVRKLLRIFHHKVVQVREIHGFVVVATAEAVCVPSERMAEAVQILLATFGSVDTTESTVTFVSTPS